jgi:hypothetical protein
MKLEQPLAESRAYLAATLSIVVFTAPAESCQRKYAVEDQTNLSVVELFYEQGGEWSHNLLAFVLNPGTRQGVEIEGQGPSEYRAKLTNGMVVSGQVADICLANEIVIFNSGGGVRMVIK